MVCKHVWAQKWRDAILMHLPEGQTSELEPLPTYKNAPRQRRVHSHTLVEKGNP